MSIDPRDFGIHRRSLLKLAAAGGLALPAASLAGQALATVPDRTFRIMMVLGRGESDNEYGFKDYLARRGLKTEFTIRNTGGDTGKLPAIMEEIRDTRPDLIYSWGTPQTRALVGPYDDPDPRKYITDIPVVFTFVAAPTDAKIVRDLNRPGRNVTGTIHIAPIAVQLNTIQAYRPVKRLGVVYNPQERNSILTIENLRAEAGPRGLELIEEPVPLNDRGEPISAAVPDAIARVARRGGEVLYIGPDTFIAFHNRTVVASEALRLGLPTFSVTELIVRTDKAMLALASSAYGIGRFTAFKAAQILVDGGTPADIPVETLKRFSIIINMATVRALEYYPPIGLLNFAEIIES
ncbi:ABC transporter substrate-binding protein [Azospirillum picis]|uniref:ABC transport system substrate-binding protein n=1 Tax=Azospirillum picis TaxID=488438 RepID=A0ABU0MFP3_9PROT|nr:ABC transporter substrate-binding protein [Azospirillum picis]MBP2298712.1 putative ABC transport system substrate-binding protein [Azospirillum picis]MDQ0532239.1 putative ABC transport system substrate-binding protein [Azospirillum picis]